MAVKDIASLTDLVEALRRSRVLEPAQLEELTRRPPTTSDPRTFARELIQRDWLTAYQVNQIFQGAAADLVMGRYVLLERLGEGGMGQVFKARHRGLERIVALKVIRKMHLRNPDAVKRFHREIQAAAKLSHPNVVMAYDADEVDGQHFFVMEYVDGIDLHRMMKQSGRLPVAEACEYIRQAALGLQHAHERGMVHRDIKPANLLVSRNSGKSGFGTVKILDMGLVRLLDSDQAPASAQITQAHKLVGTADYMAPEQALNSHKVDSRSDLYSLGCTFYHLLVGKVPFPDGKVVEKLMQHQREEPVPVEELRPEVPPAVGAIVRKLMAKRAENRYQTPAEAAAALAALELTAPPLAQVVPAPLAQIVPASAAIPTAIPLAIPTAVSVARDEIPAAIPWKAAATPREAVAIPQAQPVPPPRRRPWRMLVLGAGGGGLLAGLLLGALLLLQTPSNSGGSKPSSNQDPTRVEPGAAGALKALFARINSPEAKPADLRRDILDLRLRYPGTPEAQQAALLLTRIASPLENLQGKNIPATERFDWQPSKELVAVLGEHRQRHWGPVHVLAVSPDGHWLASGGDDRVIRVWDISGPIKEAHVLPGHTASVLALAFAPTGSLLVSGGQDNMVRLWDLTPPKPRELITFRGHTQAVTGVAFAPDGKALASCSMDGTIRFWDPTGQQPKELRQLKPQAADAGRVQALAFAPKSRVLAAGYADRAVRFWDLSATDPREGPVLADHGTAVQALTFACSGKSLAVGTADGSIKLWDLHGEAPRSMVTLKGGGGISRALAFAPEDKLLATVANNGRVRLWDPSAGDAQKPVILPPLRVAALAFASNGKVLFTGGQDNAVRCWDLSQPKPQEMAESSGQRGAMFAARFAPDGFTLAYGGGEPRMYLCDLSGQQPKEPQVLAAGAGTAITSLDLAPNGKMLAYTCGDRNVRWWDLSGKEPRESRPLAAHKEVTVTVTYSPDRKWLVTGGNDSTVRLWSLAGADPKEQHVLDGYRGAVRLLAVSPNGKLLATAGNDSLVRIWDLTGNLRTDRTIFLNNSGNASALAFSADSKLLATGSADSAVRLWDVSRPQIRENGEPMKHRKGGSVTALAFAPDGRTVLSATNAGQLVRWLTATNKEIWAWDAPGVIIHGLAMAPDGRYLATANGNGTVYVLCLPPAG